MSDLVWSSKYKDDEVGERKKAAHFRLLPSLSISLASLSCCRPTNLTLPTDTMSNPNAISIDIPSASSSAQPHKKLSRRAQRTANRGNGPAAANDDVEAGGGSEGPPEGGEKKKQKKFHHRVTPEEREDKAEKEVGVSKLKASLRQAKRFLAKVRLFVIVRSYVLVANAGWRCRCLCLQEGLSADVKIEQERKIKSLEADIEKALARNAEKKNAEKYHMVRIIRSSLRSNCSGRQEKADD